MININDTHIIITVCIIGYCFHLLKINILNETESQHLNFKVSGTYVTKDEECVQDLLSHTDTNKKK